MAAENYLQHAEHYNRIILAAQAQSGDMDQPPLNGGRFGQPELFRHEHDDDDDAVEDAGEFLPQQTPRFLERPVYNQNQPQPFIPQNAFPHVQPQLQPAPPQNGTAPFPAEGFAPGQEGAQAPRRRRRRPMNEQGAGGKSFNGRHAGGPAPANGVAGPGGDPTPDEAAS